MHSLRRSFLILVVFSLCLFIGCSGTPSSNRNATPPERQTEGRQGGELSYRLTSAPNTFNYLLAADEATVITSLYFLTSRLIEFDHETQKFVPGLAESWTRQPDGRTIDILLRDGLKFSDGEALTSDDVIFTLNAIYDKRTQAAGFRDAMLVGDQPIETKRVNDRSLQLVFPQPVASVENYLINLGVLPEHVLGADLRAGKLASAWKITAPPASIVSSGPFVVTNATVGERFEFARNPYYWKKDAEGTSLPYLDKLKVEIIADPNNTFIQLTQGTMDVADRIRASDFDELTRLGGPVRALDAGPGLGIDHLWFNLNAADPKGKALNNERKRAWFGDKRFRQAVAAAVDRESIASITLQGLASPLHGFVSPANKVWQNRDLAKINYDLGAGAKLLEEAGFQKSGPPDAPVLTDTKNNPVEFTLLVPAESEPRKLMAAIIQQDLAKLGIKMQVVPLEFGALTRRWAETYEYDAVLLGIAQGDIEPSSFQGFVLSGGEVHQWHPNQETPATEWEARIDKLFGDQAVELDPVRRYALFAEIQTIMRDEMPAIPIAARHVTTAVHSRIGNFKPSAILPYSLWNVEELFIKQ